MGEQTPHDSKDSAK